MTKPQTYIQVNGKKYSVNYEVFVDCQEVRHYKITRKQTIIETTSQREAETKLKELIEDEDAIEVKAR